LIKSFNKKFNKSSKKVKDKLDNNTFSILKELAKADEKTIKFDNIDKKGNGI
jgi:hypothetical protein